MIATIIENGHARMVANFAQLIAILSDFGPQYNPSSEEMQLPYLNDLLLRSHNAVQDVLEKNIVYNQKVKERRLAFSQLRPLSSRLIWSLEIVTGAKGMVKSAKFYHRKIHGRRANNKVKVKVNTELTAVKPNRISVSQQSYTQLVQHFAGLISVLKVVKDYQPNEVELQVATLEAMREDLDQKSTAVIISEVALSNARIKRNNALYLHTDSIYNLAKRIKLYIIGIFGKQSQIYMDIKGIKFTKYRKP